MQTLPEAAPHVAGAAVQAEKLWCLGRPVHPQSCKRGAPALPLGPAAPPTPAGRRALLQGRGRAAARRLAPSAGTAMQPRSRMLPPDLLPRASVWAGASDASRGGVATGSRWRRLLTAPTLCLRASWGCRYEPCLVAEADMGGRDPAGDGGPAFRALAGYLSGGNAAGARMAMTAPVISDTRGAMQFYMGGGRQARRPHARAAVQAICEVL